MKTSLFLAPVLFLASLSALANPVVSGNTTQATASVPSRCTITAATGISFGTYSSLSTNLTADKDAQSSITLRCTSGTTGAKVHINAGQSSGARCTSDPIRRLGSALSYHLYQDSERTLFWGCEASNARPLPDFLSSTEPLVVYIYGRIPAAQFPNQGTYTDTVSVSVVL